MKQTLIGVLALMTSGAAIADTQRIISLAPHTTELAYAAGLGDKLIAVSEYSDYPEQAEKLERVANYQGIKIERIVALEPDLILAWPTGNPARELEKLERLGFNLYYSKAKSLEGIANSLEALSQYADDPSIGLNEAKQFRAKLAELKKKYDTEDKVRYFYQLSEKPIITLSDGNWPSEVFEFCGGENIFASSKAPYPQVSPEQVIVRQPEAIFTSEHAIANGNMWQKWQQELPAVQNDHVWALTSDWLNRPTPRTLMAVTQVCEHLDWVRTQK